MGKKPEISEFISRDAEKGEVSWRWYHGFLWPGEIIFEQYYAIPRQFGSILMKFYRS
jgi:hypothetical protein